MKDEASEVQKWVETALRDATDELKRGCGTEKGLSDFKRGELCGVIIGLKRAKARMSWIPKQQEPYDALNTWIREITLHSPLTIAAAIKIYDFCNRNDLLKRPNIVERVIELGLEGRTQYDITNLLKLEALRDAQRWIKLRRGRRKHDE